MGAVIMVGIFDRITGSSADEEDDDQQLIEGADEESANGQSSDSPVDLIDEQRTNRRLREAAQELLKYGLLEESLKPNLYRIAISHVLEISDILEPLDLAIGIDDIRGLVFVTVRQSEAAEQDDWAHPLVRRQRLNLEQSLLVAILRQQFIVYEQEAGAGASEAHVAIDELIPQLQIYLGDLGSDAKERTRVIALLDQLKGHGLVSVIDSHDRVNIRPIIAHLANPENLQALLHWLREQTSVEQDTNDNEEMFE
jgi:hypothetical protein